MDSERKNKLEIRSLAPNSEFEVFSQPEQSIEYFREVERSFINGMNVLYDLSNISSISEETAAIMIAQIKDRNINLGRITQLKSPKDDGLRSKIHQWGIQKKVGEYVDDIDADRISTTKIQNKLVMNIQAKRLVQVASKYLYGDVLRIKELYEILIECMANTNNHASSNEEPVHPWFLFSFPCKDCMKFIFLDLGIGLFESLPVKQYMTKNSSLFLTLGGGLKKRGSELTKIFSALVSGNIKSSTGLLNRGRGLPLISQHAATGHFRSFCILSNDGFVDLKSNKITNMNENFSGTMLSFELQRNIEP